MRKECKKSKDTLVIYKTNFGKIIGAYEPVTIKEGAYLVKNTEAFTFYFDDNHIKVLTRKDGNHYYVGSDSYWLLYFGGISITNDRN